MKRLDLVNKKFNMFTVISFYKVVNGNAIWECRCDCGQIKFKGANDLKNNKSCGCERYTNIRGRISPMRGKSHSLATKEQMSKSRKGKRYVGGKFSEEAKANIKILRTGSGNPSWKGGISFERYPIEWTDDLKKFIRNRDNYVCFICKLKQTTKEPDVHHIDYNKKNCDPLNLITLCRNCHAKTNGKRSYWINYFKIKINHDTQANIFHMDKRKANPGKVQQIH